MDGECQIRVGPFVWIQCPTGDSGGESTCSGQRMDTPASSNQFVRKDFDHDLHGRWTIFRGSLGLTR